MGVSASPGTQSRAGAPAPPAEETRNPAEDPAPTTGENPEEDRLSGFGEGDDDEEELYYSELSSEGSADYGFIAAVSCLVTGISLVAVSYAVPRDVPEGEGSGGGGGVPAREMERLQRERARLGAHLDRCVIAGLCLLTLGGVLLSSLLMASMWKGEAMRRRALAHAAKRPRNLYGAIGRGGGDPAEDSAEF